MVGMPDRFLNRMDEVNKSILGGDFFRCVGSLRNMTGRLYELGQSQVADGDRGMYLFGVALQQRVNRAWLERPFLTVADDEIIAHQNRTQNHVMLLIKEKTCQLHAIKYG